jgi:hypothetical protein
MRWPLAFAVGLAVASAAGSCAAESATSPVSAGTLLYLGQPEWTQADGARKVALASDFMRVFCGDPGMPALDLVDCLDHGANAEPLFERALSCVAKRQR